MQVLPSTAADQNIGIKDVEKLENNVHAGHKYLRFLQDRYFNDPEIDPLDRYLFTFAAYNAGPARISSLRSPSGVHSNFQASTRAGMKPIASRMTVRRNTAAGRKSGVSVSTTCTSNHEPAF